MPIYHLWINQWCLPFICSLFLLPKSNHFHYCSAILLQYVSGLFGGEILPYEVRSLMILLEHYELFHQMVYTRQCHRIHLEISPLYLFSLILSHRNIYKHRTNLYQRAWGDWIGSTMTNQLFMASVRGTSRRRLRIHTVWHGRNRRALTATLHQTLSATVIINRMNSLRNCWLF